MLRMAARKARQSLREITDGLRGISPQEYRHVVAATLLTAAPGSVLRASQALLSSRLTFAELRPDQQREPGNSDAPARSDRDQPHHVYAADVLESRIPQNIRKRRQA